MNMTVLFLVFQNNSDDAAENNKSVDDNIANNRRVDGAATNTEPLEVVGIVKMRDSGVQVMCRKKDGKAYLLTVEGFLFRHLIHFSVSLWLHIGRLCSYFCRTLEVQKRVAFSDCRVQV